MALDRAEHEHMGSEDRTEHIGPQKIWLYSREQKKRLTQNEEDITIIFHASENSSRV